MTDNLDTILKDKLIELADQEFPKGDKGRGQAMVLIALCLQEVEQIIREERLIELDLLEQAINQGRDMNKYKMMRLEALTDSNKET